VQQRDISKGCGISRTDQPVICSAGLYPLERHVELVGPRWKYLPRMQRDTYTSIVVDARSAERPYQGLVHRIGEIDRWHGIMTL
jgi:hypothetical protein